MQTIVKLLVLIVVLMGSITTSAYAQTGGCTDPLATNYNSSATYNNGSCTYASISSTLTAAATLPIALNECSGMVYYNGKVYGHQDSGGPTELYEVDTTTGAITKTIILGGTTNVDWEDITQDDTYMYIADCGNNANGNRTDLKIYKFAKSLLTAAGSTITIPAANIEVINFSYADQTNFAPQGGNNTRFDCEAVAYNRGKLHLFTKNWVGTHSVHYTLPTTAGTYAAERKDSINTGAVKITAADFGAYDELILMGYEVTGIASCALFLDYGFDGTYYYLNTGCRRKIDISSALSYGQLEGICFVNALHGFAANEKFNPSPFPIVPQKLYSFNVYNLIKSYYEHNQQSLSGIAPIVGMIRFNSDTKKTEGYDGSHWVYLND